MVNACKMKIVAVHRIITVYSLVTSQEIGFSHTQTMHDADSAPRQNPYGRGERNLSNLAYWEPRIFGRGNWDSQDYAIENRALNYDVKKVDTYFVQLPYAGTVLVLDLEFFGGLDECIRAEQDAFDPNVKKTLKGIRFEHAALSVLNENELKDVLGGENIDLRSVKLGQDKQQLLLLSDPSMVLLEPFSVGDRLSQEMLDEGRIRKLMFKDVGIAYDPAKTPVSYPSDINGPEKMLIAVWGSNTLALGLDQYNAFDNLGNRRIEEMVRAMCQIVAATSLSRDVSAKAFVVLKRLGQDLSDGFFEPHQKERSTERISISRQRDAQLIFDANTLSLLQLQLTFGADVLRGPSLVWGGRPLESYQETLRAETQFDATLEVAVRAVTQLSNVLQTRQATANFERGLEVVMEVRAIVDRTNDVKKAALVYGTVLASIATASLFAALSSIPGSSKGAWIRPILRNADFASLLVTGAGIFGVILSWASSKNRIESPNHRIRMVGLALVTFGVIDLLAVAFLDRSKVGSHYLTVAFSLGVIAILVAVIMETLRSDYDGKKKMQV